MYVRQRQEVLMLWPPPPVLLHPHTTDITSSVSSSKPSGRPIQKFTVPQNVPKPSQSGLSSTSNISHPSDRPNALEKKRVPRSASSKHPRGTSYVQNFHSAACRQNSCCHLNLLAVAGWKTQEAPRGPSTSRSFLLNLFAHCWQEVASSWASHPEVRVARLKGDFTGSVGKVAAGSSCLPQVPFDPTWKTTLTVWLIQSP